MSTFIIAEIAGTHDGVFARAARTAGQAMSAGADAIKLQFWSDSKKEAARVNAPELAPLLERVRTPASWLPVLSKLAHDRRKEFLCTVELPEDIAVVAPYVDRFKIASTSANDEAFIAAHRPYGKPLVISTGMSAERPSYAFATWYLHCVSGYPTPLDEINLGAIRGRYDDYPFDGISDHTAHVLTGAFAVCAGAYVIEVHVRADDTPPENPDFPHSLPIPRFKQYVQYVRLAETMLGDGVKRIMPSEQPTLRYRVTV